MTRDERGASVIEYALLLSLIAFACFIAIGALGIRTSSKIDYVGHQVGGTTTTVCAGQSEDSSGSGDGSNCH